MVNLSRIRPNEMANELDRCTVSSKGKERAPNASLLQAMLVLKAVEMVSCQKYLH